jgi:hypothetical protein
MRTFEFDYQERPFKALFKEGMIRYDWQELAAFFGVAPGDKSQQVTSSQALAMLPPSQSESFREMHKTAQNTLFEIIRIDNEMD